jgi:hypothetical protein
VVCVAAGETMYLTTAHSLGRRRTVPRWRFSTDMGVLSWMSASGETKNLRAQWELRGFRRHGTA